MIQFVDQYWWIGVLVVIGLLVFTWVYYRRTLPPLKPGWRIGLGITRALAIVLLLFSLTETLVSLTPQMVDPATVVGVIDGSASMFTEEGGNPLIDRARNRWRDIAGKLPEDVEAVTTFAAESLLVADGPPEGGGSATALGRALEQIEDRYATRNISAVCVVSDGLNNLGVSPAIAGKNLDWPVVSVGVGQPDTGLGASVVSVDVGEVVFAGQPFAIRVQTTTQRAGSFRLSLRSGDEIIDEQTINIAAGGQRADIVFTTTVPEAGIHEFRIEPKGEPDRGKSFFVKALKEKTRVLLYSGYLTWDYAFVRRALNQFERVELISSATGEPNQELLDGLPVSPDEWLSYDAVIMIEPDARWLRSTWSSIAEQFENAGKGVMIVLGKQSFSRAPDAPWPLDFISRPPLWKRGEYTPTVDGRYLRHPLLRVTESPDESREIFESFPPFVGVWNFNNLPERAIVPLTSRRIGLNTPDNQPIPLLWTVKERGSKAIVVNGGPLWRWGFNASTEPGQENHFRRFLELAVRWLTVTEDLDKQRLETEKEIYASGEPIAVRGLLYDDNYSFLSRASVVARVWPDSGMTAVDTVTVFLPPGGGDFYEGLVTGLKPGTYQYAGQAVIDDDTLSMTGGKLKVEQVGLEQTASGLNELLLRQIAEESGGRYYHESDPVTFFDSLTFVARTQTLHREIEIWNQPWLLIAVLVLLTGEWFFRKRKQLL